MRDHRTEAEAIDLYIKYLEAQGVGDWAQAKRLLQASVELGEPMALHAAALQEKRVEDAIKLYIRAAEAGYAPAAWNLYVHFDDADDHDEARRWLGRAAALGDTDAATKLSD